MSSKKILIFFEELPVLDEIYAEAYCHLGIINIGMGNSAAAKELLGRFLVLDSDSQYAAIAKENL